MAGPVRPVVDRVPGVSFRAVVALGTQAVPVHFEPTFLAEAGLNHEPYSNAVDSVVFVAQPVPHGAQHRPGSAGT